MKLYFKKLLFGMVYVAVAFTLYAVILHYIPSFNISVLVSVLAVGAVAVLKRINSKKQKSEYISEVPADGVIQKNELSRILRLRDLIAELAAFITLAIPFHIAIFFKSPQPPHILVPALLIMLIIATIAFTVFDVTAWLLVRAVWKRSL